MFIQNKTWSSLTIHYKQRFSTLHIKRLMAKLNFRAAQELNSVQFLNQDDILVEACSLQITYTHVKITPTA